MVRRDGARPTAAYRRTVAWGSWSCGSVKVSRRAALVELRYAAVEPPGQEAGRPGRGADIDRRAGFLVGGGLLAVLKERRLAGVGARDLVAQLRRRVGHGDRARAYDLVLRERLVESRERFRLGAGEADAAIALCVSAVRAAARAGVERLVAVGRDN